MKERLDARLREIPPSAFHGLITIISEIDGFTGWWKGCDLPPPRLRERLEARVADVSSSAFSQIAGSGLPEPARVVPQHGKRALSAQDNASLENAAYAELLRAIFDGHREMTFGQELILELHARLLKYSPKDRAHTGMYRTAPERPTVLPDRKMESIALRAPPPHLVPEEIRVATEWTASRLGSGEFHPLLVIASFILEFLAIRPFADGNARLSRVLTTYLLLKCDYAQVPYRSLEKAMADRHPEYYLALRRSQMNRHASRPDITPWLYAFLEVVQAQTKELRALFETRFDRTQLSRNQLGVLELLEGNDEVSNRLVCRELGIPKDTAKQVLNRLLTLNLVRREGSGRAVRYRKAGVSGK